MDDLCAEFKNSLVKLERKTRDIPELNFLAEGSDGFNVSRLSDQGLINHILLVTSSHGDQSAICKYATKQAASLDITAGFTRQEIEYNALTLMYKMTDGGVPKPYHLDEDLHIVTMEYLDGWTVLGPLIKTGDVNGDLAGQIGAILGKLHFKSNPANTPNVDWQMYQEMFKCREMQDIGRYVSIKELFHNGKQWYVPTVGGQELYRGYLDKLSYLEEKILSLYDERQCVVHGDSHLDSFMTNGKDVKMIDMEFSGLGSGLYDVAHVMAYYPMYSGVTYSGDIEQDAHTKQVSLVVDCLTAMVENYRSVFGNKCHLLGNHWYSNLALLMGFHIFRSPLFQPIQERFEWNDEGRLSFMTKGYNLMAAHEDCNTLTDIIKQIYPECTQQQVK